MNLGFLFSNFFCNPCLKHDEFIDFFLRELENKKLVKGTKVLDPTGLIKYWLTIHKKPKRYREYMIKEPLKLLNTRLDYAITTYYAENLVQRHLFPSRMDIYAKERDITKWHSLFMKKGLYGKGNVRLIVTDEHIMYGRRNIKKKFVVTLPQLIVDLYTEGGPAAEAADMLLAQLDLS